MKKTDMPGGAGSRPARSEEGLARLGGSAYKAVAVVSTLLGLLVVRELFSLDGPAWAVVLAVYVVALATVSLVFLFIQEKRWESLVVDIRRDARFAAAATFMHQAHHHLRDAAFSISRGRDVSDYQPIVKESVTAFADAVSMVTGVRCRASIKELLEDPSTGADVVSRDRIRRFYVTTFCRDRGSVRAREPEERDWVSENTDFAKIFAGSVPYFHSNDLNSERQYRNSHFEEEGPRPYSATMVWPVQKVVHEAQGVVRRDIFGFLCVDSANAHVFDATHDCDLGAGYADALYSVLRLLADAASGSGGSRARTSSVSPEVGADPETER